VIAAHGLPVQVACRVLGVAADAACRPAGHHRTGRWKRIRPDNIATDRVERDFASSGPNQLWVTDITEHPTREGKVYCCVVLDTYSRVVGWSIDVSPNAALVTHALGMAIEARLGKTAEPGTIIHSVQGTQFGQRDVRVPRDLAQPQAPSQPTRMAHADRVRTQPHHHRGMRIQETPTPRNWGVWLPPDSDPIRENLS